MAAYEPDVSAAKEVPFVPAHPVGWQRPNDFGVVAEIDGAAAWVVRHIPAEDNPFHIDEHSPVVAIAVRDGVGGKGIGETLRALLDEVATHSVRLSLDVRETNSAMRLHEPVGVRRVRSQDMRNRLGTCRSAWCTAKALPPMMLTKPIPSTGEAMPVVGLGTWPVFDVGTNEASRRPLHEVVRHLVEAGGAMIDTSPMYGRSEGVIGDIVADLGLRDKAFLATKVWTSGRDRGVEQMARSARLMQAPVIDHDADPQPSSRRECGHPGAQ